MTSHRASVILRYLRRIMSRAEEGVSDRELLHRFVSQHDEEAFARLVRRHQSMVRGVALRVLGNWHDSEDVVQAAFLVLARKAASLRWRESVAGWLYRVAYHLALQSKAATGRRHNHERQAPVRATPDLLDDLRLSEAQALLDEELAALPDKYRSPILLCCLGTSTRDEAAGQLGWSLATLKRRLTKGRELLRMRLTRRGLTLSATLSASLFAPDPGTAAAKLFLPAAITGGGPSAQAVALAEGALRAMTMMKIKIGAALVLTLTLLTVGAGATMQGFIKDKEPQAKASAPNPPTPKEDKRRPTRLDRFGDPLPEGAIARLGTMRFRHGMGTGVAFAPDGKSLLTCGGDLVVRTWDLATARLLREQHLPRAGAGSPSVVLSPDGRYAAFEKLFGTVILWDLRGDKLRHEFPIEGSWPRLLFSPDSKMLVTANKDVLRVWDTTTGKGRLLGRHGQRIHSLEFTADGTLLSLADDKTLRFWDLQEGRERSRLTLTEQVPSATASPDGRVVAVTTYFAKNKSVRFWDAATGKPMKGWIGPNLKDVQSLRFSPDGKTVLVGTEDGGVLWDPIAGKRVLTLAGQSGFGFSFSPDGKSVASLGGPAGANAYTMGSMVRVWDLATGKPHIANAPERGHLAEVDGIAFAPDGRIVASSSMQDRSVRLWEAATGRLLRSLPVKEVGAFNPLSFTPDGKELLVGTNLAIVRLEVATGREVRRYSPGKKGKEDQYVGRVHLCEDGRTLLALSHYNDPAGGGPMGLGLAHTLHAWNLTTGELLRSVPLIVKDIWIYYSRFSPDGRLLVVPDGHIHDTATGKEVARLSAGDKALGTPVAFSLDGALIAVGVKGEVKRDRNTSQEVVAVQVWETATLSPVARLATGDVAHISFTPDGQRLISAGLDALTLWDIVSGRVLVRRPAPGRFRGFYGPSFANSLALAADGRTVATGNADTTILLWDLSPPAVNQPAMPLTAAQREAYWTDLAGDDAGRALAASVRLADAPVQTLEMLRSRLHPAKAPSAEELHQLIVDLDDPQFQRREAAAKRLAEWGERADAALRTALRDKPALEVRRRIEGLLAESHLVRTPETRRHLRAVRILEQIATPEARQVLEGLAKGAADARLTREAKAALMGRSRGTPEKG